MSDQPGFGIRRTLDRGSRSPLCTILLVILLVLPALASQPARAEEEGGDAPQLVTALAEPAREFLSAGAWFSLEAFKAQRGEASDPSLAAISSSAGTGGGAYQQVPFRSPAPAFSRNLLITRNYGAAQFQTEPSLAADPTDPDHLVMATIDYNMGSSMSVYVSWDAGETWDGPNQVLRFRDDFAGAGDPVLAFDELGTVYVTMISVGVREFEIGSLRSEVGVLNLAVARSTDGGLTWSDPSLASEGSVTTVSNVDDQGLERGTITFYDNDKPWISVGPNPDDPSHELIHMTYTEFEQTYGLIYAGEVPFLSDPLLATQVKMVTSADGGVTWSAPVGVSPKVYYGAGSSEGEEEEGRSADGEFTTLPFLEAEGEGTDANTESTRVVQGSQVGVQADGTVVVAWYDSTDDGVDTALGTVQVAISHDGGATFDLPVQAGVYVETPSTLRSANFRYGGLPTMALGPGGEIYVAQAGRPVDRPEDDSDIYLYRSLDGGRTFDGGFRVNGDDSAGNQFFPSIDVSSDGAVHAMWGDTRDDPVNLRYHIYYSTSTDGGETWGFSVPDQDFTAPDTRVTDFASNPERGFPGGRFIGDYWQIAATDEDVYMVWADTRLGEYGGYSQQIGFARKAAIEAPSLFLNPPSGSAGRTVDIQGFGFQADSTIQLYVSGVITTVVRSDEEGQFQTSIYMPLTGEGPTEIRAFDETGNVATASFYTEFGFDTLQGSLQEINDKLEPDQPDGTPEATPEPFSGQGNP